MEFDRKPLRPQVLAALSQVPDVVERERETAKAIQRRARSLAKRRTGTLRRNIQVERVYDPQTGFVKFLVGWGPEAWYGWMVEAGTEDVPPAPHLVPAAVAEGAVAPRGGAS